MSNDQSAVVSEETGTVYERATGEPAATPHDTVLEEEDEEAPHDGSGPRDGQV